MPAAIPAVAAVGGALISAKGAKDAAKIGASATTQNNLHPQMDGLLYGVPGQQGVISRAVGLLDRPQSQAMHDYGNAAGNYLSQYGANDMGAMRRAGYGLLDPISAPQGSAAQWNGTPQTSAALSGATPQMSAAQAGPAATMTAAQATGAPQIAAHSQGPVLWNKGETFSAPNPMQATQVQQPNSMAAAQAANVQVNAPAQNGMDLTGSYDRFINGSPGANPYLDQSISGAIAQNRLGFQQMQDDATENLMKNVMPSIRSNSVLAGQYGGSRQAIAEGNAIGTLGKEMSRAAAQFGQNATNAAVGAKANAYESDSNRALSATQGLGAQQYGVAQTNAGLTQQTNLANQQANQQANATNYSGQLTGALANASAQNNAAQTNYAGQLTTNSQNASNLQQANLANQAAGNNAAQFGANAANNASLAQAQMALNNNQFNAGLQQNAGQFNAGQINNMGQFNAGLTQSANQYNTGLQLNNNQFNAGQQQNTGQFNAGLGQQTGLANLSNQQQTNMANLQAQMGTNQLNSNNAMAGTSVLGGLLNTNYQTAGNQDSYDLNRMMNVGGLLSSFTNAGGSRVSSQPMYSNAGGAALGGGLAGFSLANQLGGLLGGGTSSQFSGEKAGNFTDLGSLFGKGGYF